MKHGAFVVFLSLVLVLYAAINAFLFIRARQGLAGSGWIRTACLWLLLLWMLAYPAGRLAEGAFHNGFSRFLVVSGSVYLAVMAAAFLLFLCSDFIRFGFRLLPFPLLRGAAASSGWASVSSAAVAGITLISTCFGFWNASVVRVRTYDFDIPKSAGGPAGLRIAAVSDLHLGTVLGRKHMEKVAEKIRGIDPDIVIFAGDVLDEDPTGAEEQNVAEVIRSLPSRYGLFAVLGNHEHFHDPRRAADYLRRAGVTVLEDQAVRVAGAVWIAGRKDRMAEHGGHGRMPLAELVGKLDPKEPRILIDHQPFHLEEAERNGVDLEIAGHTHHGQLFPFNGITNRVYELSWGHLQKGATHVVVSSGAGTWGPPVRTAGRTEVLDIRLRFTGSAETTP
jgi:uncharacterized protein